MLFESEESRIAESRSRMISFRVTTEEFDRFRRLCLQKGVRNVSEVVRLAVNQLLAEDPCTAPTATRHEHEVTTRLENLESRMAHLESRLTPNQVTPSPVAALANSQ